MTKHTIKELENRQEKLQAKIPQKYQGILLDIINLEYRLTMIQQGHDSELIF